MDTKHFNCFKYLIRVVAFCFIFFSVSTTYAQQITLNVQGAAGESIGNYRWLIEEDVNQDVVPGVTCQPAHYDGCMSLEFHKSYMPLVAKGNNTDPMPDLDPAKRYFISILPDSAGTDGGYSNGGTKITAGQTEVLVTVNALPFPTAQIRVFVFNDSLPINNVPDAPEQGLEGFEIRLEDAGGRYGASGQQIATDAYGNPLGTSYFADGTVDVMGDGIIKTDANGVALIKNLVPAKYGIFVVPPAGQGWIQTSTIEGTNIIDAWVKADEPAYFAEFGPPGPHVFVGFTRQFDNTALLTGSTRTTITGQVRTIHNSAPPNFAFHTGAPVPGCWVALNNLAVGVGEGVFAAPCNGDSTFSISNIPPGNYQLAIWDENLGYIFATRNITVDPAGTCNNGGSCNLLDVPVFSWFARLEQYVFHDENENGIWDTGELGMPEEGTAIRWRDGTIYQEFPTDLSGAAPYDEVFPFFSWLVAEVGFGRYKATGATMVYDLGGPIDPGQWDGMLNPSAVRTTTVPVLTQGFQAFMGQTNVIMWGKAPYKQLADGHYENGGISGIVFYAITRAENDPAYAAAEPWEPGIPRIQVALYEDSDGDGVIDDQAARNGGIADGIQLADVDNYPFGWADGTAAKGPEDFEYGVVDGIYSQGDAIQVTHTDSWDDNVPSGCGNTFNPDGNTSVVVDCYDGLRAFNQVKDAVFDGGYAFGDIPAGTYIVGVGDHPVYDILKQEDKNVDFGDTYVLPNLLPAACVGDDHLVPAEFSMFPNSGLVVPDAGKTVKLCDLKQVYLAEAANAATDFFLFTNVPIAGHIVGFILDDSTNEFDPNAPTFGEKYSPPYLPVSIRDWKGNEISRTYSDRWGRFNALVPSTYTTNVPSSSGMSPNMLTTCMNDPGTSKGGPIDPFYNPQYSQFCYTFQYMPGATTYLDTPVVPVAAFTGPNANALDCQVPTGTPVISTAVGSALGSVGPFVEMTGGTITLTSAVDPQGIRDLGFGANTGKVYLDGTEMATTSWTNQNVVVTIPAAAAPSSGLLEIERADGTRGITGIKVHVGVPVYDGVAANVINVHAGQSIQSVINDPSTKPGDLILVGAGTYNEMIIMSKPVMLQGAGAASVINAMNAPAEKLLNWRVLADSLAFDGAVSLLPGQVQPTVRGNKTTLATTEPDLFFTEEGAGVFVLINKDDVIQGNGRNRTVVEYGVDGLAITGADHSGGIIVHAYAQGIEISNNRIFTNNGSFGGGIRFGHPTLGDGANKDAKVHHNYVAANGSISAQAAGGGITMYEGTNKYSVTDNYICGNFSAGNGGGIGHYGLSNDGLIAHNRILFNQTFNQGTNVSGGGIYIGGAPVLNALTAGSGSVQIVGNLIQGNQAGAGDGGGIRTALVNGTDVVDANGSKPQNAWYRIDMVNNMIVNNVAGMAGGGISMQDTVYSYITNNTVANNNSTATAGDAFNPGNPNQSVAQPAGIVSRAHSAELALAFNNFAPGEFVAYSNPVMNNNIIMDNRSFYFSIDSTQDPAQFGLFDAGMQDMAVLGTAGNLVSNSSLMTGDALADDVFLTPYVNTGVGQTIKQVELTTTIDVQPAFDEGGNFIQVTFGPLAPTGDYHLEPSGVLDALLGTGNPAIDNADNSIAPPDDIDGDSRLGTATDIGADEVN